MRVVMYEVHSPLQLGVVANGVHHLAPEQCHDNAIEGLGVNICIAGRCILWPGLPQWGCLAFGRSCGSECPWQLADAQRTWRRAAPWCLQPPC